MQTDSDVLGPRNFVRILADKYIGGRKLIDDGLDIGTRQSELRGVFRILPVVYFVGGRFDLADGLGSFVVGIEVCLGEGPPAMGDPIPLLEVNWVERSDPHSHTFRADWYIPAGA